MDYRQHISVRRADAEAACLAALGRGIEQKALSHRLSPSDETPTPDDSDTPLDEAVREEREYVRRRLREELQREPTDEEVDDWLRRHTEGY